MDKERICNLGEPMIMNEARGGKDHTYSEAIVLVLNFQLDIFTSSVNIEWTNKHPQETTYNVCK